MTSVDVEVRLSALEARRAARAAARTCEGCALCCKLLTVPELDKPRGEWCRHVVGYRCAIYRDPVRPARCGAWSCAWREGVLEDDEHPLRTDVVVGRTTLVVEGREVPAFRAFERFRGARYGSAARRLLTRLAKTHRVQLVEGR